ncbi:hypothetical protein C1141_20695, partial [Vibrio agarivorans]
NRYSASYPSIIIPKVLDGVTVKEIGDWAFARNNLTSVTIPDSVTTIGKGAFNGNALSAINNAPSDGFIFARNEDGTENKKVVISYGGATKEVTIPDSVTSIGEDAFAWNKLTSVTLPDSVTTIGEGAFSSNKLTNVTLPDSVTTVGEWAFGNNDLTSVTLPDSVTTIGEGTFDDSVKIKRN